MIEMPSHQFGRYTVVINARQRETGQWIAGYSIHDGSVTVQGGLASLPLVASRSVLAHGPFFATKAEAIDEAVEDTHAWIAKNP